MRSPLRLLAFLLLTAAAARGQDATPAPGPRERPVVVEIRFEGNRRYTDAFLKEQILTKEGQRLDAALLGRDERILREYFAGVTEIAEEPVEGGLALVFHVLDRQVVGKVEVLGLSRIQPEDFEGLLATRRGRPLLEQALRADRELLERLHREKGYHFAAVSWSTTRTTKPDVVDVTFQVIVGKRVRVREVILEGARSLERSDLLKVVKNSDAYRKKFLGLGKLFAPVYLDRVALDEDRARLELYYREEGFRDARVVLVDLRFDEEQGEARIVYSVDEGERYAFSDLEVVWVDGDAPDPVDAEFLSTGALAGLAVFARGDPFRLEDLNATERAIADRLWSRAYATSAIDRRLTEDPGTHTVRVQLTLSAGPKVRVGKIRIYGNRFTRDNVIRRSFPEGARPGDFLDIQALQAAQTRLQQTRFFNYVRLGNGQDWGLRRDPTAVEEDLYDIELEVEEGETRSFNIGAGISTDGGAFATLSVTWRNFDIARPPARIWDLFDQDVFRGAGQTFTIAVSPGTVFSTYEVSFFDPALRDGRWSFGTGLSRRLARFDEYSQITDQVYVRVGRFLDVRRDWSVQLEWNLRQVAIDDPEPYAPVNALDVQGTSVVHELGFRLRRTRRNEADAFLNGHISTLSGSISGGLLSGDVDIGKVEFEHRSGFRFLKQTSGGWHRIQVSVNASYATAYGDTDEVPIFERFFLGGQSLRGFAFRGVGPRSNGSPAGGEYAMTVSTQYTIPLAQPGDAGFSLDLVFFLDQGSLVSTIGDLDWESGASAAGFGVAIGFGGPTQPPLLVDFGLAPAPRGPGDERQVVSVPSSATSERGGRSRAASRNRMPARASARRESGAPQPGRIRDHVKQRAQRTLARDVELNGVGLHTGARVRLRLLAADLGSGIVFRRVDLDGRPEVPARIEFMHEQPRRSSLRDGVAEVHTVEHLLAAIHAFELDNVICELDGPEMPGHGRLEPRIRPGPPGGRRPRAEGTRRELHAARAHLAERRRLGHRGAAARGGAAPDLHARLREPAPHPPDVDASTSASSASSSRCPTPAPSSRRTRSRRCASRASGRAPIETNTCVISADAAKDAESLRFPDEYVRHKVLDLVGDLALLGRPLHAHIVAQRTGHRANRALVNRVQAEMQPPGGAGAHQACARPLASRRSCGCCRTATRSCWSTA